MRHKRILRLVSMLMVIAAFAAANAAGWADRPLAGWFD
jgi:hypothetical protein